LTTAAASASACALDLASFSAISYAST
jgi:hypothetical protein